MAPILIAMKDPKTIIAGARAGKNDTAYLDIVNVNTAILSLSRQEQRTREWDEERTRDWRKSDMLSLHSMFAIDSLACKIIKDLPGHHFFVSFLLVRLPCSGPMSVMMGALHNEVVPGRPPCGPPYVRRVRISGTLDFLIDSAPDSSLFCDAPPRVRQLGQPFPL
jgi:hypothetical protein